MKIKVAIASLAVATVVVAAFAFTPSKKLAIQTVYYHPSGDKTLVAPGQSNSLVSSEMITAGNWNTTSISFSTNGTKLAAITFNEDNVADGPADGALTMTEAINFLEEKYTSVSPNDLPADGSSFRVESENPSQFTDITVRRKD
jgi:hypothetical protein